MHKKGWMQKGMGFITFSLKVTLYALLGATFFLLMSVDNPQLRNPSRTLGVMLVTFGVLGLSLTSAFGGYAIGRQKSKPIIYSIFISVVIADVATFLQLMIMNVNDANRAHFYILPADIAMLFASMVIQLGLTALFAYIGNFIFFKINPPERCCIIAGPNADIARIVEKIRRYRLQFSVEEVVDYRSGSIESVIKSCDTVFLCALPPGEKSALVQLAYKYKKNIYIASDIVDIIAHSAAPTMLDDMSFMASVKHELTLEQRFLKRSMDIVIALVCVVLTSPVMLACAAAIRMLDGGPVFFTQRRYTRGGRIFRIIKFRTMQPLPFVDQPTPALEDDARITAVGRVLRRFRLDELPQFFNILKGEMSLVGPRPEMVENFERYMRDVPEFGDRLKVKAGLTGYAQIAGKYNTPPRDKMMLDLMYIETYSLWLDIKLILRTPSVFFKSDSTQGFEPKRACDEAVGDGKRRSQING